MKICSYICSDRIRHASRRKTSEPGRVFYFQTMGTLYTKRPISIADQIAKLK